MRKIYLFGKDFLRKFRFTTLIIISLFFISNVNATTITIAITSGTNPTCAGSSVTFTATAVGGNKPFAYQWNKNGTPISGQTATTYTTTTLANGDQITCTQTSNASQNTIVTSSPITMSVSSSAPTGLTYTLNSPVYCLGTSILNNSPTSGGGAPISYSISSLPAGLTFNMSTGIISGTPTAATASANYTVIATNGCGSTNKILNITISAPPNSPTAPIAQSACSNSTQNFTFSNVTAGSGGDQIEYATNSSFTSSTIAASPATVTVNAVASGATTTVYIRSKNSTTGCVSASVTTTATVNALPVAPAAPAAQSICSNSAQNFTFSNITAGSGGNQIEYATNAGFTGSTIATSPATVMVNAVASGTTTTIYIRSRNSTTGCVSSAVTTTATVNALPMAPVVPAAQSICSNSAQNFTFSNVTAGSGGDQIEYATNSGFTGSMISASPATITINAVASGTTVTVYIRSRNSTTGCVSIAVTTTVTVNPLPVVAAIGGGQSSVCVNGTTAAFTDATSGGTWSILNGSGSASITSGGVVMGSTAGNVTVIYTYSNGTCSNTSTTSLTVTNPPDISSFSAAASDVCASGSSTVTITSSSLLNGTYTVTYDLSGANSVTSNVSSMNFNAGIGSFVTTALPNPGVTSVTITGVTLACSASLSSGNVSMFTVDAPQTATVATTPINYCGLLTSGPLGGNMPTAGTGLWTQTSGPGTTTFSNVSLGSSTGTVSSYGSYVYKWTITNGTCTSSASVTVNYYATPTAATVATTPLNYCGVLITGTLGGNTPTTGTGLWTQTGGVGTTTFSNSSSGSSTATATSYGTYVYTWTISNGTCTSSASVTVNYYVRPSIYNVTTTANFYCSNTAGVTIGLSNSQSGVNYQLYNGATAVGSAVAGTGSAISFGTQTSGTYTVIATNVTTGCTQTMSGSQIISGVQEPFVDAGAASTICASSSQGIAVATISGTASNYSSLQWTSPTGGTFGNATSLNTTYTPSAADRTAGSVTLTLKAFGNSPCANALSTVLITITSIIDVNSANNWTQTATCSGNGVLLLKHGLTQCLIIQ